MAQKVTQAFLKRFTPQTLKQQALEAESFFKQTKAVYSPEWHEKGLKKVNSRLSLYQKMQRGGFDRLDPFVDVGVRRQVGEFNFGGKICSLEGKVAAKISSATLRSCTLVSCRRRLPFIISAIQYVSLSARRYTPILFLLSRWAVFPVAMIAESEDWGNRGRGRHRILHTTEKEPVSKKPSACRIPKATERQGSSAPVSAD